MEYAFVKPKITRTIWLLLDTVHRLVCGSFTKDHNVSETGSVSVLRWMGQVDLLSWARQKELVSITGPSTYQTMDRVQKKPNSSVRVNK
jgi:hypothetical protein